MSDQITNTGRKTAADQLAEVREFLTYEQGVTPAMVDALEAPDDDLTAEDRAELLAEYATALREQIGAAWGMTEVSR